MRPKTCLKLIVPLLNRPSFTAKEAKELGVSSATLCHYVNSGEIVRLKRGVYRSATFDDSRHFLWGDLISAVSEIPSGTVCLISALAVYDLADEIPRQHWIAIPNSTSVKSNSSTKLVRFRRWELGRTKIDLEGSSIYIYDLERTLVDAFRLLNIDIFVKALKNAAQNSSKRKLDILKLEHYATELRCHIKPYLIGVLEC